MSPRDKPRVWPSAAVVFLVALAVRLSHVVALRESPYFSRPVLDAETYYWAARSLAAGEGWDERVYWQPPGYPYFLAMVLRVAGPGFFAPRLVQAVLGALTAALTCALGARVFGRAVGLGAGLVVALYGLLVYYDAELLAPSLAICLQMATLWSAARAPEERGGRGWLATGLLGGLTAVVNAPALVLVPVLTIAARRRAGWVLLGAVLAIAPVTARNWVQGQELLLISSNGGINLYLGNNPRYDETAGLRPGRDWQALVRAPALHGVTGAGPASRFFTARVTAYARQNPGGFVRLQIRKLGLLLAGNEIPRNQEIYPTRAWSPVLRVLLWKVPGMAFPFGLLLPLAVVGLGVAASARPGPGGVGRPAEPHRRRVLRDGALSRASGAAARAVRGGRGALGARRGDPAGPCGGGRGRGGRLPARQCRAGADAGADELRCRAGPGPLAGKRGAGARRPSRCTSWLAEGDPELVRRVVRGRPAGRPRSASPTRRGRLSHESARPGLSSPDTALLLARAASLAAGCGAEAEGFAARAVGPRRVAAIWL